MTTEFASAGLYKEPGMPARFFVYGFAALSPLLTLGVILVPAIVLVRMEGAGEILAAVLAGLAWAAVLGFGVRSARRLASRFTPPLPLPRRSLEHRRPPAAEAEQQLAVAPSAAPAGRRHAVAPGRLSSVPTRWLC